MRKVLSAGFAIALTLASGGIHASAGTSEDPEISDPAGDANFISPITGIEEDTRPASLDNADLRAVWFETAYEINRILDPETGAILRVEHVPTDFLVHIETEAPIHPVQPEGRTLWYEVHVTLADCQAFFSLNASSDFPQVQRATIWAITSGCADVNPGSGENSPVSPSFEDALTTLTFPLDDPGMSKFIRTGAAIDEPSARVVVQRISTARLIADDTATGRTFTVGQDVPQDVDCSVEPDNAECQS